MSNPTEQFIEQLAESFVESWYVAEDFGTDKFTEVMTNDMSEDKKSLRREVFEATCYYVIQQLVYGGSLDEEQVSKLITEIQEIHLVKEDC